MSYTSAVAWVAAMNRANYLGHSDWQLPTNPVRDGGCQLNRNVSFGFGCSASALGSLYYRGLALHAPNPAIQVHGGAIGPFTNFQPYLYWSQTGNRRVIHSYHTFSFNTGFSGSNARRNFLFVLPLFKGRVPGTASSVGTGLQVDASGQTAFDPVANVTWLTNANLALTNTFGLPRCTRADSSALCVNSNGSMTRDSAVQFISNMNTYNGVGYLRQANWELPVIDEGCRGYNCGGSENPMGELFYGQLKLKQGEPVVAVANDRVGPFKNFQPYLYWACQGAAIRRPCDVVGPAPNFEWSFSFGNGFEGTDLLHNALYTTAYFIGQRSSTPSSKFDQ